MPQTVTIAGISVPSACNVALALGQFRPPQFLTSTWFFSLSKFDHEPSAGVEVSIWTVTAASWTQVVLAPLAFIRLLVLDSLCLGRLPGCGSRSHTLENFVPVPHWRLTITWSVWGKWLSLDLARGDRFLPQTVERKLLVWKWTQRQVVRFSNWVRIVSHSCINQVQNCTLAMLTMGST